MARHGRVTVIKPMVWTCSSIPTMNTLTVSLLHRLSSRVTIFLRTVSESELTHGGVPAKIEETMSAQDDLITAARSLRDQGLSAYSLADLLSTARRYGSTYPDPVLRKTIESMVASPDDAAQNRDVFVEVRKGYYRLRR
jgi:hypothetical protein